MFLYVILYKHKGWLFCAWILSAFSVWKLWVRAISGVVYIVCMCLAPNLSNMLRWIRPLARIERWFAREFGAWGAGLMFLCLKSLRMYNLKVYVREISGMYILYVCVWHPISRTCGVKIRPSARIERWFAREFGAWGAGLMFLCLNSLRMYNLKVYVREISGMYILYVCVWHPISRTCCVEIRPLARMERSITREFGAWGAGLMFLCLNSLRMYNLNVYVREISGMYILYVCVWHPISRTCCVKIRPLARMERRITREFGAWGAGVWFYAWILSALAGWRLWVREKYWL
jgi:hypothetical protein